MSRSPDPGDSKFDVYTHRCHDREMDKLTGGYHDIGRMGWLMRTILPGMRYGMRHSECGSIFPVASGVCGMCRGR